ncbi:hypothetical protein LOTGIDRAFT_208479 [Lottia gigantea]|uniref:DNA mismatch repair protein MSH3 n=1 Tax=Lottia gigantea TaxID=225164 RepID=V4B4P5_LOTGI|nr:hypothetical protein LOTGIDRAFT_208479 [Lottia gigantea]ESP05453.1 hypothetical protein LOTGIDRAFT_208479 [Lottia gigantea]
MTDDNNGPGPSTSRFTKFSATKTKPFFNKIKYTPLEQQFLEIKKQYDDAILFVECGYKYRFFREDAEIAAKVLKIYCHLDHNFMTASIPTHRLFVHVRRLVAAGYKVGVVKQMETAALKAAGDNRNTPFNRKLSALYTKSTLIGEDILFTILSFSRHITNPKCIDIDDKQSAIQYTNHVKPNNYLMCIYDGIGRDSAKRNVAIVAIDPATGDVVYDNFIDDDIRSCLETRITHINPVELLIPQTISDTTYKLLQDIVALSSTEDDRIRTEKIADENFTQDKSKEIISEFMKNENGEYGCYGRHKILNLPKPVLCCISGLIVYLHEFNLHNILKITGNFNKFSIKNNYMQLNGTTLRNLEIFKNSTDCTEKGCLFGVLNYTVSKYGCRLLKSWLAQPLLDIKEIIKRQEAVENLLSTNQKLQKLKLLLNKSPDLERTLCSIFHQKCSVLEFYTVVKSLEKIYKEIKMLYIDIDMFKDSELLTKIFQELPELLYDITTYSQNINETAARENDKTKLFNKEDNYPDIMNIKEEINEVLKDIKDHRKDIRLILHQPSLDYVTVSQTEFLIEVKNTLLKQVPKDWVTISSTKAVTRFHSALIVSKVKRLNQLKEELVIVCNKLWLQLLLEFGSYFVRYRKAVNYLATIDCLLSLSSVSLQNHFTRPVFSENKKCIKITQGRHPVISTLFSNQQQFVPNDTNLADERMMIITGPNMGGKSSYIKQVALLCIMAQIGSYIPADEMTLSVIDAIYTRMGAADEIFKGRSTFMVELQEASNIMKEASSNSLVILDELGRGTSTFDGLAIATATAHYFINQVQCFTLFVTHYPSLGELELFFPGMVGNYHMSFLLNENDSDITDSITFLYELVKGQAGKSYGLNVAQLANIDSSILTTAKWRSQQLENEIQSKRCNLDVFLKIFLSKNDEEVKKQIKVLNEKV